MLHKTLSPFIILPIILLSSFTTHGGDNKVIFHDKVVIGDSEACAEAHMAANDGIPTLCKSSTTIEWWADNVPDVVKNVNIVIIFLGANNCDSSKTNSSVDTLIKKLNAQQCIWVGPPLIRGEKCAIVEPLRAAVKNKCIYIDSSALNIEQRDRVHPTLTGAMMWWNTIERIMRFQNVSTE
jgi:hypothetical protein